MTNTLDGINDRLDTAKEKISRLQDIINRHYSKWNRKENKMKQKGKQNETKTNEHGINDWKRKWLSQQGKKKHLTKSNIQSW